VRVESDAGDGQEQLHSLLPFRFQTSLKPELAYSA
jgi:hypothetical protein